MDELVQSWMDRLQLISVIVSAISLLRFDLVSRTASPRANGRYVFKVCLTESLPIDYILCCNRGTITRDHNARQCGLGFTGRSSGQRSPCRCSRSARLRRDHVFLRRILSHPVQALHGEARGAQSRSRPP